VPAPQESTFFVICRVILPFEARSGLFRPFKSGEPAKFATDAHAREREKETHLRGDPDDNNNDERKAPRESKKLD